MQQPACSTQHSTAQHLSVALACKRRAERNCCHPWQQLHSHSEVAARCALGQGRPCQAGAAAARSCMTPQTLACASFISKWKRLRRLATGAPLLKQGSPLSAMSDTVAIMGSATVRACQRFHAAHMFHQQQLHHSCCKGDCCTAADTHAVANDSKATHACNCAPMQFLLSSTESHGSRRSF